MSAALVDLEALEHLRTALDALPGRLIVIQEADDDATAAQIQAVVNAARQIVGQPSDPRPTALAEEIAAKEARRDRRAELRRAMLEIEIQARAEGLWWGET